MASSDQASAPAVTGHRRVAILVTHSYYPGRPDRDDATFTERLQVAPLRAACAAINITIEPVFWQDEGIDWKQYDAVCPLIAWTYPLHKELFLQRLAEIEAAGVLLLNSGAVLRANMDKAYLAELAQRGAPVPKTRAVEKCTADVILASFDALQTDEIIIKPRVGAGAWRQARLRRGDPVPDADHLPPDCALIQPFLHTVKTEGELSLVYFGGRFSHAIIKKPRAGDYRTQGQHGAIETRLEDVPASALAAAEAVMAKADGAPFTYARVDLVRDEQAGWLLMELELIEPWLYLAYDGQDGRHGAAGFATALAEALQQASRS